MPRKNSKSSKKSITLRDVVIHMQGMEQRLSSGIADNSSKLDEHGRMLNEHGRMLNEHGRKIDQNTRAIGNLTLRIDAFEEDLTATIKDTLKIRRHVGMATSSEIED